MNKIIEFDQEELEFLKDRVAYLLKNEGEELTRLIKARENGYAPNRDANKQFMTQSKRIIDILGRIQNKLVGDP